MTDKTDPAVTDDDRRLAREWAESIESATNSVESTTNPWSDRALAAARVILNDVPAPPPPTLADMSDVERAACLRMQCDTGPNRSVRGFIAEVHPGGCRVIERDTWEWRSCSDDMVTPRPDLRRIEWPGEPEAEDATPDAPSLIGPDMDGVLVLRSLTKVWGLAGVRAGYVVGDPALVARLREAQEPWSVSTPALAAMVACASPDAVAEADALARRVAAARPALVAGLEGLGLPVVPGDAPFVCFDTASLGPEALRVALAERGFAVRRGETFPGLGPTWLRVAVRDPETSAAFVAALADLAGGRVPEPAQQKGLR